MDDAILDDILEDAIRVTIKPILEKMLNGEQTFEEAVDTYSSYLEKLGEWRVNCGITEKSRYYPRKGE